MPENATRTRWNELLSGIAGLLPARSASVLVDGDGPEPLILAARLADALPAATIRLPGEIVRRPGQRRGQRPARREDVLIWVRAAPADRAGGNGSSCVSGGGGFRRQGESSATIVVDMQDPNWPVIRSVAAPLARGGQWYLAETRAFFAARAATWDTNFGDDLPAYAAAIAAAGIPRGATAVDVGCGTGRALPALREAVGPHGTVIAIDITPEMLREASCPGRAAGAALLVADARRLPLGDGSADAVFAAGLVSHLPDAEAGLRELARITRPGGLLMLFHPSGRAALAARHGRVLAPDEPLAAIPLQRSTLATGWDLTTYDDAADRFFALAVRR